VNKRLGDPDPVKPQIVSNPYKFITQSSIVAVNVNSQALQVQRAGLTALLSVMLFTPGARSYDNMLAIFKPHLFELLKQIGIDGFAAITVAVQFGFGEMFAQFNQYR
jgi:hypothetical protein